MTRDVHIATGDGEYMIAADGDETVGELHDKTGCTEADDTFRERNAGGKVIFSKQADFDSPLCGAEK